MEPVTTNRIERHEMTNLLARYRARKDGDERELGFTLIELLIVIIVLGILAAVTVFALTGVTSKSATSACNSDAATVNTAIQAYDAQNSYSPPTATVAAVGTPPTFGLLVPTYLQSIPSNSTHYTISIGTTVTAGGNAGVVMVAAPATNTIAAVWTPGSTLCNAAT